MLPQYLAGDDSPVGGLSLPQVSLQEITPYQGMHEVSSFFKDFKEKCADLTAL